MSSWSCRAFVLMLLLGAAAVVHAQPGAWLEYAYEPFGSGSRLFKCGRTCLGFTYEDAARLVFFDTGSDTWSETDLDFVQHWDHMEANGDLVMAVSDSFVVAYNARTAQSHILRYEGEVMVTHPFDGAQGCGRALAFLLTDTRLYVFDAGLDAWQAYDYGLPPDYNGWCHVVVHDTYVAAVFNREYPARRKNVVYSLPVHAFNQTDSGAGLGDADEVLDYGFASTTGQPPDVALVGYSALTNQFSVVEVPFEHDPYSINPSSVALKDLRTTFAISFVELVESHVLSVNHSWGYDTIGGCWSYLARPYDPDDVQPLDSWRTGGRFASKSTTYWDDGHLEFTIYNGRDGQFTVHTPEVDEDGTQVGGDALVWGWGGDTVCGFCPETGLGQPRTLDRSWTSYGTTGEDFISFGRRESGADRMTLYFYHGPTNSWTTSSIWDDPQSSFACGTHVYGRLESDLDREIVFYSPILNTVQTHNFPLDGIWGYGYSDYFACFWNNLDTGAFFDASTGLVDVVAFEFNHDCISNDVCLGLNADARTIHGYSRLTGNWTPLTIAESPRLWSAVGQLGLASVLYLNNKFWAFNGFYATWVELVPSGTLAGLQQGEAIILVVRSDRLYAFDPDAMLVGVEDDPADRPHATPGAPSLHPCYPNPLNPETLVTFELPVAERISLAAFDLRGRRVRIMADGTWPAGRHSLRWDGRDGEGRQVASGTYVLRLDAGASVATAKIAVVR